MEGFKTYLLAKRIVPGKKGQAWGRTTKSA